MWKFIFSSSGVQKWNWSDFLQNGVKMFFLWKHLQKRIVKYYQYYFLDFGHSFLSPFLEFSFIFFWWRMHLPRDTAWVENKVPQIRKKYLLLIIDINVCNVNYHWPKQHWIWAFSFWVMSFFALVPEIFQWKFTQ